MQKTLYFYQKSSALTICEAGQIKLIYMPRSLMHNQADEVSRQMSLKLVSSDKIAYKPIEQYHWKVLPMLIKKILGASLNFCVYSSHGSLNQKIIVVHKTNHNILSQAGTTSRRCEHIMERISVAYLIFNINNAHLPSRRVVLGLMGLCMEQSLILKRFQKFLTCAHLETYWR